MNERERIGVRIREIRTSKGISQQQLSETTGMKQQSIARIESGKFSTGIDILAKIADVLGCTIEFNEKAQNKRNDTFKIC